MTLFFDNQNGRIGIGKSAFESCLDMGDRTEPIILPKLDESHKKTLTPTEGMLFYDKTTKTLNVYGDSWGSFPYVQIISNTNINGLSLGTIDLFVVPSDKIVIITQIIIRVVSITNVNPSIKISVGTNSIANNIYPTNIFTGLVNTESYSILSLNNISFSSSVAKPEEKVKIKVTANGTNLTLGVIILGIKL